MRNLFIYNPVSGRKKSKKKYIGEIIQDLTCDGATLSVYQTQGKNDVRDFLQNNISSYDRIICCGGDGTLHEVVNGILKNEADVLLGYIPAGSTNDYAKSLGINSKNALMNLKDGRYKKLDVGSFNGEYFNYVAAFGAFVNVSFTTPQNVKNKFGYLAYLMEGIKHFSDIQSKHVRCNLDDTIIEDDILIGMITNTFSVAGIESKIGKKTELDDGFMEYIFIKKVSNILELHAVMSALVNARIDEKYMYAGKARDIVIESENLEWTLDGENGGVHDRVEIKTHYRVLNMVVGEISE